MTGDDNIREQQTGGHTSGTGTNGDDGSTQIPPTVRRVLDQQLPEDVKRLLAELGVTDPLQFVDWLRTQLAADGSGVWQRCMVCGLHHEPGSVCPPPLPRRIPRRAQLGGQGAHPSMVVYDEVQMFAGTGVVSDTSEHFGSWAVILTSHLPYHVSAAWIIDGDRDQAARFAAFVTREIDPAVVLPLLSRWDLREPGEGDPVTMRQELRAALGLDGHDGGGEQ